MEKEENKPTSQEEKKLQFGNPEHIALARKTNGEDCNGTETAKKEIKDGYVYYKIKAIGVGVWKDNEFLQEADYKEYEEPDYDVDLVIRGFEYLKNDKEFDFRTPVEDIILNYWRNP